MGAVILYGTETGTGELVADAIADVLAADHDPAVYDMAEYAVEAATAKSGPLAGIPVSSEGYKFAVASLKTKLRHGELADMWQDFDACRLQHEQANIERQQAETEFNTQRKLAELKAMILRASSI